MVRAIVVLSMCCIQMRVPGSIFSINLAGQPIVVLNDFTTAADLLGKCARFDLIHVSHISNRSSLQYLQQQTKVHRGM